MLDWYFGILGPGPNVDYCMFRAENSREKLANAI